MGTIAIGIDLGQKVDPSAVSVSDEEEGIYAIRHLERLEIGTPYPKVAARIGEICRNLLEREVRRESQRQLMPVTDPLRRQAAQNIWVVADGTGVGGPVVELIAAELEGTYINVCAAFFTHGDRANVGKWGSKREVSIGKAYLVSRLQSLIQTRRIELPQTSEARALAKELQDYEIRIDQNANDTYGAFKVGTHDDLVTALGLSVIMDRPKRPAPRSYDGFTGEDTTARNVFRI